MEGRPCAVCINCSSSFPAEPVPDSFLSRLLGMGSLPKPHTLSKEDLNVYELHLETKYYSADIWLCTLVERNLRNEEFANSVEAVVLYFDGAWTATLDQWLSFVKQWDPQVRILTCERVSEEEQLRSSVAEWCSRHEFEMVELDPSPESRAEAEEYRETVGIERLVQILKAHSWSNLQIKDGSDPGIAQRLKEYLEEDLPSSALHTDTSLSDETAPSTTKSKLKESESANLSGSGSQTRQLEDADPEAVLKAVCAEEEPEGVSFEELFAKFASMKEEADNMPPDQRKAYAEKVTIAFWKAIGGNDEEIEDLDD